ncbi:hypothetical protein AX16_004554 [Volvariella volvacea WC 439]|nr:hypothetical protein AX16_004554 [Volvariella volvacea WC 439]
MTSSGTSDTIVTSSHPIPEKNSFHKCVNIPDKYLPTHDEVVNFINHYADDVRFDRGTEQGAVHLTGVALKLPSTFTQA